MLWQLDVSLTNLDQSRMSRVELDGQSLKRELHQVSIFMYLRVFQDFHADIESDRSFGHLFCLNSRLRATTPEDLQGING